MRIMMPVAFLLRRLAVFFPLLFCSALGCGRATPVEEETAPPAPVKWMEARQLFISEWTEIIGTTQPLPARSAQVTAAVEGHVVSVLQDGAGKPISEGQRVKQGQVLVRLYDQIARNTRDKAAVDLEVLKQQIDEAQSAIKLAEIEVRSRKELLSRGENLASRVDLERAEVALEAARSKEKAAELSARAGAAQLKALDDQLHLYALTAPISGRLGRLLVVPGQTLAIGAPVAEIVDLDDQIDLLCFVPERTKKKLREGQEVRIGTIDELAGGPVSSGAPSEKGNASSTGKIVFIAEQAEVASGNFAVKARFPNARLQLHGFVTLRAQVLTTPGKAALTLPESALMEDHDPPTVIVVENEKVEKKGDKETETGTARKVQARVGIRDRVLHLVEIVGLDDPEKKWRGSLDTAKFVIEKGQGLKTGDAIRLEEEDEDEAPAAGENKKD
jgi:RND family efflux transporter MFP subunit